MAARQVAVGREKTGTVSVPTVEESVAVGVAAAEAAELPAGWTPSRFFEAWKKEVGLRQGFVLFWNFMGYCKGLTPRARRGAIDSILRTTVNSSAYDTDDFFEGVMAANNDYEAMKAYVSAFVDAFWKDFWEGHRDRRAGGEAGPAALPASRRAG